MKRPVVLFGIITLLIIAGLAGCISEESKFEGTWRTIPIAGISMGFTFKSDGTLTIEGTETSLGTWKIEENTLIITADTDESIKISGTFIYEFSDDNKKVTLTQNGTMITLIKN